jgi:hypothetical protein
MAVVEMKRILEMVRVGEKDQKKNPRNGPKGIIPTCFDRRGGRRFGVKHAGWKALF